MLAWLRASAVLALLPLATAFANPHQLSAASAQQRRASSLVMKEETPKLNLPSITTALLGALCVQSGVQLSTAVPAWLAGDGASLTSVVINAGFVCYAIFNLIKATGVIGKYSYASLDDLEVGSFAREAGEWALAGEIPTRSKDGRYEVATFAGGCFWGTELHFQRLPGVIATCVGYTQGAVERPTYAQVCDGTTGHTEGLQLIFDPDCISYEALCDKLLSTVDPTALNRVGNDMGTQYRHGLYPHSAGQDAAARRCVERVQATVSPRRVVTEIKPAAVFWPAEGYHQRYLQKGGQDASKGSAEKVRCYG